GPIFQQTAKRIAGLDNEIEKQIIEKGADSNTWVYAPQLKGLMVDEAATLLKKQDIPYNLEGSGKWIAGQQPAGGDSLSLTQNITLKLVSQSVDTTGLAKNYSVIPDVGGMSMRKATQLISSRGFKTKMIGSGTVYTQ